MANLPLDKSSPSPQERLLEIAQQLDELAEDGRSELTALSEELGAIAAQWPLAKGGPIPGPFYTQQGPQWLYDIQRIVEQAIAERLRDPYSDPRGPWNRRMWFSDTDPNAALGYRYPALKLDG